MSDISLETTTSADGTTIGYLRRGRGPALVITHGSVATSEQWIPATEHLAEHFTCYVHDRRARGRSGDTTSYQLSTEVADIAAMMALAGCRTPPRRPPTGRRGSVSWLHDARSWYSAGKLALWSPSTGERRPDLAVGGGAVTH